MDMKEISKKMHSFTVMSPLPMEMSIVLFRQRTLYLIGRVETDEKYCIAVKE